MEDKIVKNFITFDIIIMMFFVLYNIYLFYNINYTYNHGGIDDVIALIAVIFFLPFYLYFPIIECIFGLIIFVSLLNKKEISLKLKKDNFYHLPLLTFVIYSIYFIINNFPKYTINIILTCVAITIWIQILIYMDKSFNKIYLKLYSIISFLHYILIYWLSFKYIFYYLNLKI